MNDILQEAKDVTDLILALTKGLALAGTTEKEEEDVEAYAKLMETRQPLVDKLMELKEGIDLVMKSSPEFADIKKTIENIASLDKKYLTFMGQKKEAVQQSHKAIKQGQKIHEGYTDLPPDSGSRMFDTKQ